ncbi:MAG: biopolymer transporter ExbD [Lentisphaerae bacterium]|jgi:biopolymer transport protein ExbD|nr:biopolymer transporter ExbD [Lentisphaerota bacterium]MBT5606237.1 biopolymer transporter ExbD [Lentisphaerota bacterium]MBT7054310.1 biopolymer transporter ExbD [Lentisphaerota bacterium]MBT7843301.1 biopolymer transporter ExbD [Lentisphaerota bacterium]
MQVDLREDEAIEVQMAPLIDCVFLLLIFFLVATTLKKIDEELPLELPESAAAIEVQQPDQYTVISVDRNESFYVDGTPVSLGLLQSTLRKLGAASAAPKIRLDVDEDVPFKRVMEILDILRFEELTNVGINSRKAKFDPERP